MIAVIMAGGKGTRIASVSTEVPKPMIPLCGKPVLEWQLGMPEGTEYYGDPSCNGTSASGDFGLFRGRKPDGDADILSG